MSNARGFCRLEDASKATLIERCRSQAAAIKTLQDEVRTLREDAKRLAQSLRPPAPKSHHPATVSPKPDGYRHPYPPICKPLRRGRVA